ncbi:MAG: FHA domain-containing protein [Vicinamibacterales bacterium]
MAAPSVLKIGVDKGPRSGAEVRLMPGQTVTIGRQAGCGLVLDGDDFVAPLHAEINWRNGAPILRNLSSNGTLVNGRPVNEHPLGVGDRIGIGLMHLVSVRAVVPTKDAAPVAATPSPLNRPAGRTSAKPRDPADASSKPKSIFKMPLWLRAYLVAMAAVFVLFAIQKSRTPAPVGVLQVQQQERQFAEARKLPDAETERVLHLLELGAVYERRGDSRSAYESYREALSARQRVEPQSPGFRYAALRLAELGRK